MARKLKRPPVVWNKAIAMEEYARLANDPELMARAAEIKEWATRRLGEIMEDNRQTGLLAKGGAEKGRPKRKNAGPKSTRIPTLADQNIDKRLADRARMRDAQGRASGALGAALDLVTLDGGGP